MCSAPAGVQAHLNSAGRLPTENARQHYAAPCHMWCCNSPLRSCSRQSLATVPSWLTIEGSCVTRHADLLVL
jgi:hypothetical protein